MFVSNFSTSAFNGLEMLHNDDIDESLVHSIDDGESNPKLLSDKIPENATNIDEVEAMIAKQMMALSVKDREKIYMDVHAVKERTTETEEAIEEGLESMQIEIEKLQDKEAYELAWSMDRHYVENRSFRLAFLRADSFDARKAAIRIVRHFQLKLDLFGREKLALDIVQDDLNRESIESLYSGRFQMLDVKDCAGRMIGLQVLGKMFSTKATLQRDFYIATNAIRNPDLQIHGLVIVVYTLTENPLLGNTETHWNSAKIIEGLPMRIEAIHFCHHSLVLQMVFAIAKMALPPSLRIRTRTHHGTHQEIMSMLASHGIAPGTIPVAEGGKVTNYEANHQRLTELRCMDRLNRPRRQKVCVPSKFDVLFGKGTPFQTHSGNVKLRTMVSERYRRYEKAEKGQKKEIVDEIVKTIQQESGLFLRPDNDCWVYVEDDAARRKVSASFRTLRVKSGDR